MRSQLQLRAACSVRFHRWRLAINTTAVRATPVPPPPPLLPLPLPARVSGSLRIFGKNKKWRCAYMAVALYCVLSILPPDTGTCQTCFNVWEGAFLPKELHFSPKNSQIFTKKINFHLNKLLPFRDAVLCIKYLWVAVLRMVESFGCCGCCYCFTSTVQSLSLYCK